MKVKNIFPVLFLLLPLMAGIASASDYNMWKFNEIINVSNPSMVQGFQAMLNLSYNISMEFQPDFRDIRFSDTNGNSLPYFTESIVNNSYAHIWIALPANVSQIYMYSGNDNVSSASSASDVFDFSDGLDGNWNSSKWSESKSTGCNITYGEYLSCYCPATMNLNSYVKSVNAVGGSNTILEGSFSVDNTGNNGNIYAQVGYGFPYFALGNGVLIRDASSGNNNIYLVQKTSTVTESIAGTIGTVSTTLQKFSLINDGSKYTASISSSQSPSIVYTTDNKILLGVNSRTDKTPTNPLRVNVSWIRVRKYSSNPPTLSSSDVSMPTTTNISNIVKTALTSRSDWNGRPELCRLPDGNLAMLYREASRHWPDPIYEKWHIRYSADNGTTWTNDDTLPNGTSSSFFPFATDGVTAHDCASVIAPNSDVLILLKSLNTTNSLPSQQLRSTDGGYTWKNEGVVNWTSTLGYNTSELTMPTDYKIIDGKLYIGVCIVLGSSLTPPARSGLARSDDNGKSYSLIYVSPIGSDEVGIEYIGNDQLLTVFRDSNSTTTYAAKIYTNGTISGKIYDIGYLGVIQRPRVFRTLGGDLILIGRDYTPLTSDTGIWVVNDTAEKELLKYDFSSGIIDGGYCDIIELWKNHFLLLTYEGPSFTNTNVYQYTFDLSSQYNKLIAGYSADNRSSKAPLSVSFTDKSTNSPTSWLWVFGDGSNSMTQNPIHVYSTPGNYTVSLTASNTNESSTERKLNFISITQGAPHANFSLDKLSGQIPLTINFIDQSFGGGPYTYLWDFGDGQNSTLQSPSHTYFTAGNYTVNLTVSNAIGTNSKLATIMVLANAALPVANFTSNVTLGYSPLAVQFTDLSENATGWNWDFGDGTISKEQNPVHNYSIVGNYTVILIVSNTAGSNSMTKIGYITVTALPIVSQRPLPYWIDKDKNLWLNLTLNNSSQTFTITKTTGYVPSDSVMWFHDNFSSGSLDSNKWTVAKQGSSNATVAVTSGHLALDGVRGISSSGNAILNKSFTNGIEIAVDQTVSLGAKSQYGRYSDTSFGSGALTSYDSDGVSWWHTMFSSNGGIFASDGYSDTLYYSNTTTHTLSSEANPASFIIPSSNRHTMFYGYDKNGVAYSAISGPSHKTTLTIPDPYNQNQFVHPSVIYNESGIFGHKYWMLITPFANKNSDMENPCLYYSDDGFNWNIPTGVTNPIDEKPTSDGGYNSDPELIYNPTLNKIMCYYREQVESDPNTTDEIRMRTYDGLAVSAETNVTGPYGVSPSVILRSGTYYMWMVDIYSTPRIVNLFTSKNGISFVFNRTIETTLTSRDPWHIEVIESPNQSAVYGLLSYCNLGSDASGVANWFAKADNITSNFAVQSSPLMQVSNSSLLNLGITSMYYRTTGIWKDNSNISKGMKLWFSGFSGNNSQTAYTEIMPDSNNIWKVVNYDKESNLITYSDPIYLNDTKQWMLSQGTYSGWASGERDVYEVWGYKTGHDPFIGVSDKGSYKQISITPSDSQNIPDYQVMIPASYLGLSSTTDSLDIESVLTPVANFTSNNTIGNVPFDVQFNDTSSGIITSWDWDFGDGSPHATTQNPIHRYNASGNYTVTMEVANAVGGSNQITKRNYITALISSPQPVLPVANFINNVSQGYSPLSVQFSDRSENATSWNWSFGDGSNSTQQNPIHIYSDAGNYKVTLTVSNENGTDTKSSYIIVLNSPNITNANFLASSSFGKAPLSVSFTDTSSGSPTSWKWDFGDGINSTDQNPVHIYNKTGLYSVTLTASKTGSSSTVTKYNYIAVSNDIESPVAAFSASTTSGSMPLTVDFTDNSDGSPTSWKWDFGDGTYSTLQNPVYTYNKIGNYNVSLKVKNAGGSSTETIYEYIAVK